MREHSLASDEIMKRLGFALIVLFTAGTAQASPEGELRGRASSALAAMNGNAQRVRTLLHKARVGNLPAEARCLDGALSRVDAAVRSGRDESRALDLALMRGDSGSAARALLALLGFREATRTGASAADACLSGVEVVPVDSTVVTFVVDPSVPSDRAVFGP